MSSKTSLAQMPHKTQQIGNGLNNAKYSSSSATLASLSPPSRHNSLQHNNSPITSRRQHRGGSVVDEIPLGEIFRLIAHMKICVVRRAGSDVEGQISSVIDGAARSLQQNGINNVEEGEGMQPTIPVAHFLSVGQQNAGQMLDWVQRKGLPIIFLNGDCIGGLTELKALEKNGFLRECLCPHQFDLVVIGTNEIAQKAVEEAISFGKKVALVEMGHNGNGKGIRNRLAKEAIIQAALMRITIEEARSNGWTVEGEEGQKVSFWLNWSTVREGILAEEKAENERIEAIFEQGKVQRFKALACQFSGFHELTVCPDQDSEEFAKGGLVKLSANRFLLATNSEPKMLENVPGAREFTTQSVDLFTLENNPGKTLFFCQNTLLEDLSILESAAILRSLGNDVTIMCSTKSSMVSGNNAAFDPEMIEFIKEEKMAKKGIRFIFCVPTKFEQLREPMSDRAGVIRVYAMSSSNTMTMIDGIENAQWTPFLEEFNTVVLSVGKRQEPLQGFGLDKLGVLMGSSSSDGGQCQQFRQQQSTSMPNIYAIGDAIAGDQAINTDLWGCFEAKQLMKKMFIGQLNPTVPTDLCRTIFLPPFEYSCCGLNELEAERKHGKHGINVFRDGEVPIEGAIKAKMICAKFEQDRVIGLHIIGSNASKLLQGYSLAMQIGLTRAKMVEMKC